MKTKITLIVGNILWGIRSFFQLLSGVNISALKSCQSDHNWYAAIGFIIFATTLIAFWSGYIAGGTFFPDSLIIPVISGIVFCTLIFAIDFAIVTSIKKDPTKPQNPFNKSLATRAAIGLFIGFLMSLPLELKIFRNHIDVQLKKMADKEIIQRQKNLSVIYSISPLESKIKNFNEEDQKLQELKNNTCPWPKYKDKLSECNQYKDELVSLEKTFNDLQTQVNYIYAQTPPDSNGKKEPNLTSNDWKVIYARNNTKQKVNNTHNEYNNLVKQAEGIKNEYYGEIDNKIKESSAARTSVAQQLKSNSDSLNETINEFIGLLRIPGFEKKVEALWSDWSSENLWIHILHTLFTILFICLEILPTFVKLTTPVGNYDWRVYADEKIFEKRILSEIKIQSIIENSNVDAEEKIITQTQQYRTTQEIENKKKQIDSEMVLAQKETGLSEKIIEAEKEIKRISTDRTILDDTEKYSLQKTMELNKATIDKKIESRKKSLDEILSAENELNRDLVRRWKETMQRKKENDMDAFVKNNSHQINGSTQNV